MKPQTKTAQHTPGPWTHEDDPDTGDRVVIDENLMVICRRPNMFDAHLIAAAPDLLEACQMVSGQDVPPEVIRAIRAAIKKATNE